MTSAGRILIMPKGEWKSETEYDRLDLVRHKGSCWISKTNSLGVEPGTDSEEFWMDMFSIQDILNTNIGLTEDKLGQSAFASDLFKTYATPTFVKWDSTTLNTPYVTEANEGFALVCGDEQNHTVVAWTKGGNENNIFIHQINEGNDNGWDSFLKLSGGTLNGKLNINMPNPRIQMKNENNSRFAIFESNQDGHACLGNWKASNDQVNLQLRHPSTEINPIQGRENENACKLTLNGNQAFRMFGEHNLPLLLEKLSSASFGVNIATGSYPGTGKAGSSQKNQITFDFVPKIVLLSTNGMYDGTCVWHHGVSKILLRTSDSYAYYLNFDVNDKTLEWYSSYGASYQLNTENVIYHWVAIG